MNIKSGKLYITITETPVSDYKTFQIFYIKRNTICLLLNQIPYDTETSAYLFLIQNKIVQYHNLIDYFGNNFNELKYHL